MEQLDHLRKSLIEWFSTPVTNHITQETGITETAWVNDLLKPLARSLSLSENDSAVVLCGYLNNTANRNAQGDKAFFELLRHLELTIDAVQEAKQRRGYREKLFQFYSDAFLQFPFESKEMVYLEFEQAGKGSDNKIVPYTLSDLELKSAYPIPDGVIGWDSREEYKKWRKSEKSNSSVSITDQWFTHCPKAYLRLAHDKKVETAVKKLRLPCFQEKDILFSWGKGSEKKIRSDQKKTQIYPQTVVQAAWHALLNHVENKRDMLRLYSGPFESSVVTYPTSLLPEPRKEIGKIFSELGVLHSDLLFDEAISPTLFYFEQHYGMSNELGPEAFKIRCTHHYGTEYAEHSWYHQMLILDIGAGTTDIAIVQIRLTENLSAQKPESGGRVYTIAPRLLGSAGSEKSGGNAITLNIFHYLKILLADYLVHHVASGADKQVSWNIEDITPRHFETLKAKAEIELPTQYERKTNEDEDKERGNKKRKADTDRFFALWDWAEMIKIEFSDRLDRHERKDIFNYMLLSHWDEFRDKILVGTKYSSNSKLEIPDTVAFQYDKFAAWAEGVFNGSITTAIELAKKSLKKPSDEIGLPLRIDSIVLSGRACQLPLIREKLENSIHADAEFASDRTEILFVSDFAKVATAGGACLGKKILQGAVRGKATNEIPRLHAGLCERNLNIDNLFFFLPSDFTMPVAEGSEEIFRMQTPFKPFDLTNVGKIRTNDFLQIRDVMRIHRGSSAESVYWGKLDRETLSVRKDLEEDLKNGRVKFEIDHDLALSALILYPKKNPEREEVVTEPYFLLDAPLDSRNKKNFRPAAYSGKLLPDDEKWKKYFYINGALPDVLTHSIYVGKPSDTNSRLLLEAGTPFADICVQIDSMVDGDEVLDKLDDISDDNMLEMATDVMEGSKLQAESERIHRIKGCRTKDAIASSGTKKRYVLSDEIPLELYAEINGEEHLFLTKIDLKTKPQKGEDSSESFSFEKDYRLLVTQDGRFNVFIGDTPPYWETTDHRQWRWPGQIWRKVLDPPDDSKIDNDDPFNGMQ